MENLDWDLSENFESRSPDPAEQRAKKDLLDIFSSEPTRVFFSRQLEVRLERNYFHWITSRALRSLEAEGKIISERRGLAFGGQVKLYWSRKNRYVKREINKVIDIVQQYSAPGVTGALGHHGELLVIEAFARNEYLVKGRETNQYGGKKWLETDHNLDLIVEKNGIGYGIEVKNTLTYMDEDELLIKIRLCEAIEVKPVFVVRMMPATWVLRLISKGGYAMILKWQLYPRAQANLAKLVNQELGLPVDSPRALAQGTMDKFNRWHDRSL